MIVFDKTEFDLGTIKYGETKTVIVNVSNTSPIPATLTTANSSCSCTTGSLKATRLLPNQTTEFRISLNTVKSGKGNNIVRSIALKYAIGNQQYSQTFRLKVNIV